MTACPVGAITINAAGAKDVVDEVVFGLQDLDRRARTLAGGREGMDFVSRILAAAPGHLNPAGVLACEVGSARPALEQAYPRLPLVWPRDEVFIYEPARTPAAARISATRRPGAG